MLFLGAVAFFLSAIWLVWYLFTTLAAPVLGLAALALVGMAFMALIATVKSMGGV